MNCRHCNNKLNYKFLDLGFSPPSNAYLIDEDLSKPERYLPLRLRICSECWLVQTEDYEGPEAIFDKDYAYFSSTSHSWLKHAEAYSAMIIPELNLTEKSLVMEVASNDGYLLKHFISKGIPNFGVEPTESTAKHAIEIGVCVDQDFFGVNYANKLVSGEAPITESYKGEKGRLCDLIIGNNVYAHVPDINDFTHGLKIALNQSGTINLEFPHLLNLIQLNQFDTVYHEHFSYLSLYTVVAIFAKYDLKIYRVEEITTHGGSLRVYGCHNDDTRQIEDSVNDVLRAEAVAGLKKISTFREFQSKAEMIKNDLLNFLITAKASGNTVAAYGAAAKGNTLLNFSGVKPDLISSVFDAAPAKQGKFMPGSHIPILNPNMIKEIRPDYLLILPWNLRSEITSSCSYISEWGGKFVIAVPELQIL
ncbi:class I SAM-dependent methyltransferase [Alphaproteobacteria bacterium]|nr:class I SAM-dependent methyltransferase [Alphaproteobacteria bacterium]